MFFRGFPVMKKTLFPIVLASALFSISACSTYNSVVPSWATIGNSKIANLENKMDDAADSLDFEEAARLRDEIRRITSEAGSAVLTVEADNESTWWNPFSWW
jgi:hypothetical protein